MPKAPKSRTGPCTSADASRRLKDARAFLEYAELASAEKGDAYGRVSASLAVTAGIAAADAACCQALGYRSRGASHREALDVLARVEPDGRKASKNLGSLLDVKDSAQYGLGEVRGTDLKRAIRAAQSLVTWAGTIVGR